MSPLLAELSPSRTSHPRERSESRQQGREWEGRGQERWKTPEREVGRFWKVLRLHNSNGLKGAVKGGGRAGQQLPGE